MEVEECKDVLKDGSLERLYVLVGGVNEGGERTSEVNKRSEASHVSSQEGDTDFGQA